MEHFPSAHHSSSGAHSSTAGLADDPKLSPQAKDVWESLQSLSPKERDRIVSEMLRQTPLTFIVGGADCGCPLSIYSRGDVNGILGEIAYRQWTKPASS
jgi:hypothetical protein